MLSINQAGWQVGFLFSLISQVSEVTANATGEKKGNKMKGKGRCVFIFTSQHAHIISISQFSSLRDEDRGILISCNENL